MTAASATALLQELVRIPSVNPHGDPGVAAVGEARCAAFIADYLRDLGAEVTVADVEPGRPNVIGRFPSRQPGKGRLFLAPHLDTVGVNGMTVAPFGGELRDGKLYGRGASDTKGSAAAMLWALREQRARLADLGREIWFVGLMGEEAGLRGSQAFVERLLAEPGFRPGDHFAVAGEPTELQVVHTTKGALWLRATAHGRSAHAAHPELGDNAIGKMARLIVAVETEIAPALAAVADPVLGQPTISAGIIRGGNKINVVPDRCEAELDVRTVPGFDPVPWLARMTAVGPGLEVAVLAEAPPLRTDPGHPLIRALGALGARPVAAPWFCDAASFAAAGIPAVALGPGNIAQAHTADEWIATAAVEAGAQFFERLLGVC